MKGRPPALRPAQQEEVRRRLAAGEGVRALAAEFKVGKATIGRLAGHAGQIRKVAETLVAAQTALESLPPAQQHQALSLAEKLRSISDNLAAAAMHGAATAHRLNALANNEVAKIDDAEPLASLDALRGVGVLSKLANESASVALNLLAANRPTVERLNQPTPPTPSIDPTKLSPETLAELLAARDAGASSD
jgi:CHAD domain-containing protein